MKKIFILLLIVCYFSSCNSKYNLTRSLKIKIENKTAVKQTLKISASSSKDSISFEVEAKGTKDVKWNPNLSGGDGSFTYQVRTLKKEKGYYTNQAIAPFDNDVTLTIYNDSLVYKTNSN